MKSSNTRVCAWQHSVQLHTADEILWSVISLLWTAAPEELILCTDILAICFFLWKITGRLFEYVAGM